MERAKLEEIILDEEDAALFTLKDDLLLKAKAIKYSILPKLNTILEETLSRIRKIYNIEVFKENSIIHSAPNFREKRENDLKVDYTYAFYGLGASHLPIWKGIIRLDNKPAKIIPYIIGYWFDDNGLTLIFNPVRYKGNFTKETNEIFLNFLLKNNDYIQTIQSLSRMVLVLNMDDKKGTIKPFIETIEEYRENGYYDLWFIRTIKSPLDYNDLNSLIRSFTIFFPVYYAMLEISQSKECTFKNILSEMNYYQMINDYPDKEKDISADTKEIDKINFNENKFIRAGVRWQVFERDDFKCVACGKSASDGAILHVDHIKPRSKGGRDTMDNYQTLCHLCNIGKSNKSEKNLRK